MLKSLSLQNRIIAVIVLLLAGCMSVFSFFSYRTGYATREKLARAEMRRAASLIATAHSMERAPDWNKTRNYLSTILGLYSNGTESDLLELFYILMKDESGRLAAYEVNYELARHYGLKLTDAVGIPLDEKSYENGNKIASLIENSVPDMDTIVMPVIVNGRRLGTIELGYLVKQLAAAERAAAAKNAVALAALCLLGALAAALIARREVHPIRSVALAMKKVAAGNPDVTVPPAGSGETRSLVEGFNSMAADLKRSGEEIELKTRELRESETKYRTLFHSAGDGILLLDPEGTCLDANVEAVRLFARTPSEISNTFIFDLVHPIGIGRDFRNCPERWSGTIDTAGAKPREVETLLSTIDSEKTMAVIRDVTPWREAERAVLDIKKRQQKLIEDLPVGILTLDARLRITTCNRYMEKLLGRPAADLAGAPWQSVESLFGNGGLKDELSSVMENGREAVVPEVVLETGDSGRRLLELRIGPFMEDPETPTSVMIVAEDISEKAEMRRIHDELQQRMLQSQKMEAVGTLAAGLARDFNNLLAVIIGNTHAALDPRQAMLDIRRAALRAKDLTMKLLAFARKDKPQERVAGVNSLLEDLVEFLKRSLPPNILITWKPDSAAPRIKADTSQIFQALLNVCNNARDSMPGGGTLALETISMEDGDVRFGPGRFCLIRITDSGAGIPEYHLNRIFDPFFTTKPPTAGTGLGLSTTLGIIENHGGQISISSRPGEGTRFEIYLPCTDEELSPEPAARSQSTPAGSETILVVDAEKMILNLAKRLLEGAGYHVLTAQPGPEALQKFKQSRGPVNLFMIDLSLPGTAGAETFHALAAADTRTPFILVSGYSREDLLSDIMKTGRVRSFIQKPFVPEILLSTVREVLDNEDRPRERP